MNTSEIWLQWLIDYNSGATKGVYSYTDTPSNVARKLRGKEFNPGYKVKVDNDKVIITTPQKRSK